jgi:hypothetical protein
VDVDTLLRAMPDIHVSTLSGRIANLRRSECERG